MFGFYSCACSIHTGLCGCVPATVYLCLGVWRPDVDAWYLSAALHLIYSVRISLWAWSSWDLPISAAWCWASRHMPHLASVFLTSEWHFFFLQTKPSPQPLVFWRLLWVLCVSHTFVFLIIMVADRFHNKYFYIQRCCIFTSRGLLLCTEEFSLYVSSPQLPQHTASYSLNIKLWVSVYIFIVLDFLPEIK